MSRKTETVRYSVVCLCSRKKTFDVVVEIEKGSQGKHEDIIQKYCPFCDQLEMDVKIDGKIVRDTDITRTGH